LQGNSIALDPATVEHMESSSPQFKILAVDDSPIYRKLVQQSLSQEQYTPAIFAADAHDPDHRVSFSRPVSTNDSPR
jgi:response regulator RpfG family c-di-GMP phosphodiesterase